MPPREMPARRAVSRTRVVTASCDKTARVWDVATAHQPARASRQGGEPAFSPDGTRVVTASSDNTARMWDLRLNTRTLEQWPAIAERSPFVLQGQSLLRPAHHRPHTALDPEPPCRSRAGSACAGPCRHRCSARVSPPASCDPAPRRPRATSRRLLRADHRHLGLCTQPLDVMSEPVAIPLLATALRNRPADQLRVGCASPGERKEARTQQRGHLERPPRAARLADPKVDGEEAAPDDDSGCSVGGGGGAGFAVPAVALAIVRRRRRRSAR